MEGRTLRPTGRRGGRAGPQAVILAVGSSLGLLLSACGAPGLYVPGDPAAEVPGSPVPGANGGSANAPTTAWSRAIAGISRDGTVPLETALAAFSVAFGPIPGVETPAGDPEVIGSASGPTRWILNHWDELTPDQQAAVDRYLAAEGPASVRTDPIAGLGPLTAAVLDQSGYQRLGDEMAVKVGERLGRTVGVPIEVVLRDLPPSEEGEILYANTIPLDAAGDPARASTPKMARCQVQVGKATQVLEGVVDQEAIMAHEVFHCFQYALAKQLADAMAMPAWLAEGAGAWVGEEIAGGGSTIGNKYWQGWMATPTFALFPRSYTAIGFFANLKTAGVDVWGRLDKMQLAAVGKSADAYRIAVGGDEGEAAVDAWGPSYISDEQVGPAWYMFGPGKPLGSVAVFIRDAMGELDQYVIVEDPLAAYPLRLAVDSDVFVIAPKMAVRGLMHDRSNGTQKLVDVAGKPFCLKPGGCACPGGSAGAAHQFGTLAAGEEFYLGFSGHTDGIDLDLLTFRLETACELAPEDFLPPENCYCPLGLSEPRLTPVALAGR